MPPSSAAMELKVLISVLQQGNVLQNMLGQTKQLAAALAQLQTQAGKIPAGGPPAPPTPPKQKIDEGTEALKNMDAVATRLVSTLKFLAGGFLALQSVRFLKDLADTAARAQVLGTVLHVVGNNAGYSTAALDKADRQIQALGITAQASRQALTQFIQAELNLADAPKLARAAQDAAIILGTNSSDAFERLVNAVQTTNTLTLRHMGIILSADTAYQKYAQSIGKSVTQLTSAQKAQAFLNATLVQTNRLHGAYTAAMGDVGKQITSLERFTTDLKTSLGNNLLPAYLAIVEELTIFLQKMNLVADGLYGQGQGAKQLGEDIKSLAHSFFEIAGFLVEYRKEIGAVIVTWALFSKIVLPIIAGLNAIALAFTTGAESGGALGLVVELLGGPFTAFLIVLTGLAIYFPRVRAGVYALADAFWVLAEVGGLVLFVITKGIIAALIMLYKMMSDPLHPEAWIQPWKDWATGVENQIERVKKSWGNMAKQFAEIFAPSPEDTTTPAATPEDKRALAREEEAKAIAEVKAQERELIELKKTGEKQQIIDADKALTEAKKKLAKLTEDRKADQASRGLGPGALKIEQDKLDEAIAQKERDRLTKMLEAVGAKEKFFYFDGEVSKGFSEQVGQFNDLLEVFNANANQAGVSARRLGTQFVEAGAAAKTRSDFEALNKALKDLVDSPSFKLLSKADQREVLGRARAAITTAGRGVFQERAREIATVTKIQEDQLANTQKRRADALQNELELFQITNGLAEDADRESYTRRGMDLDEYYNRRLVRLQAASDQEAKTLADKTKAAQEKRDLDVPRTAEEKASLQTAVDEAKAAQVRQQVQAAASVIKLTTEREDVREDKLSRSRQAVLDIRAAYGDEEEALDAINFKLDEQLKKANTRGERQAIEYERRQAIFENEAKYRERAVQLGLIEEKQLQEMLSLDQARLDTAKAHVAALQKSGNLTDFEAMQARNALARQQAEVNRQVALSKTIELQRLQLAMDAEELAIVTFMHGIEASDEATRLKVRTDLASRRQEIQGLQAEVEKLTQAVNDSEAEIESYAKTLKATFVDGFANALTVSIRHFSEAGKAWVSLSQQIADQIVGIFTKAFTQRLFKNMGLFDFADRSMNWLFGGGGGSIPFSQFSGVSAPTPGGFGKAEGGVISGPGTGTSDSVPIMASTGEHIMPAAKAAQWMPVLEGIRTGKILPFRMGGTVQSIAAAGIIPRRYANGGVVMDGGASAVQPGGSGPSALIVKLDPAAMNMTMREWLEREVVYENSRR